MATYKGFCVRDDHSSDRGVVDEVLFYRDNVISWLVLSKTPTIFDLGANIGAVSVQYAKEYPRAGIISVEMDGENVSYLARNVRPYPDITVVHGAIVGVTRDVSYHRMPSHNNLTISDKGTTTVHGFTIDDLVHRYGVGKVDLIKMDIEGSESEVFLGIQDAYWPEITKNLIVETHNGNIDFCRERLLAMGFLVENHPSSPRIEGLVARKVKR